MLTPPIYFYFKCNYSYYKVFNIFLVLVIFLAVTKLLSNYFLFITPPFKNILINFHFYSMYNLKLHC